MAGHALVGKCLTKSSGLGILHNISVRIEWKVCAVPSLRNSLFVVTRRMLQTDDVTQSSFQSLVKMR